MVIAQTSERQGVRHYGTRVPISLACCDCKARNYKTTKGAANDPGAAKRSDHLIELKKFCKQCKKHTLHRETK